MLKKQRKNTTLLQRATTLVRSATMSQVHPTARSHAADYQQTSDGASTATDSMDREEMEVWQQFRKELLKHFPTFEDQMEARMTPNLVDSTGLSGRDGGLFTGETLLHIAIVQHRNETVAWLLEGGAAIDSRAGGVFFQPQLFETFGVSRCVREYWVRILQNMKSCRLSAPRWHESPSPPAAPLQNIKTLAFFFLFAAKLELGVRARRSIACSAPTSACEESAGAVAALSAEVLAQVHCAA